MIHNYEKIKGKELLLLIIKNFDKFVGQIETKFKESSELKSIKSS